MKRLNNYDSAQAYSDRDKLPVGGYILKILDVKYQEGDSGKSDIIILSFDIAEGDYKDFFRRDYNNNTNEDRKWRGTYRIWVPTDDGSDNDNRTMRRFKTIMSDFEDSNKGYHWDWNEQSLKGKLIGGIFNNREYNFNGRHGFYTNCYGLTTVDKIRNNTFKMPGDSLLKNSSANSSSGSDWMNVPEGSDDSLPF